MPATNEIELQDDIVIKDMLKLHWAQFIFIGVARAWCEERGLPFKITSINSDRIGVVEQSQVHPEFRGIDTSDEKWTDSEKSIFVSFMNKILAKLAAFSPKTGIPVAVVLHDTGKGLHFHFQNRRGLRLSHLLEMLKLS